MVFFADSNHVVDKTFYLGFVGNNDGLAGLQFFQHFTDFIELFQAEAIGRLV